ncbi:acyl-CoA-binding protein [Psychroflexus aestuariivivens]|uniref:acyl-CoA-binding protein n=1 Tax=Psychroflexus aestuariivivens TaxID=1795040 RepID=UPI000FD70490|nr:acyl-CoA-binding protein [Psychroflexus aestuariivivens]
MELDNLTESELDHLFFKAYQKVSRTKRKFPQDTLLYFYAFYKHATRDNQLNVTHNPMNGEELVNAFKANALFQVKTISEKQAKKEYIKLAQKHLNGEFDLEK